MSGSRFLGTLILSSTFALASPAFARPLGCAEQCDPETPDDIACTCWERAGAPVSTCGEYRENMCGLLVAPPDDSSVESLQSPEHVEASFNTSGQRETQEPLEANVCRATS